ncbi:MAG: hypothetical protein OK438_01315 [Thaumarchaeota archaeon]|nr:hypothetical protein [Nitrososphaerota archaeon]
MNDYEKTFILKTTRLRNSGVDFQELAREALTGKFGGAVDVLLRDLSGRALNEPEHFVREMSKMFGRGAMGVYEPIIKYVDMGLYGSSQAPPILGLLQQLGPAQSPTSGEKPVFLHEHRIKDEEGNYPDNAN